MIVISMKYVKKYNSKMHIKYRIKIEISKESKLTNTCS